VPAETEVNIDGVKLELVLVPPGRFLMGSPETEPAHAPEEFQHAVELTRPFYISRFAVTQEQFQRLMNRNPSSFQKGKIDDQRLAGLSDTKRLPVEEVTWYDAVELCNQLSLRQGKRPCYRLTDVRRGGDSEITKAGVEIVAGADGFRLATEAEWEFAARAGTRSPFFFGDTLNGDRANCNGEHPYGTDVKGKFWDRPQPVGSYEANALGLCDMHGNVWQWCQDGAHARRWYRADFFHSEAAHKDPQGSVSGALHVMRGGAWFNYPWSCRAAIRAAYPPEFRTDGIGIRVVRPLD
jgi:formylglycine-generating enzyme required for sulfatase activity